MDRKILQDKPFPADAPRDLSMVSKAVDVKFMLRPRSFIGWLLMILGAMLVPVMILASVVTYANDGTVAPVLAVNLGAGLAEFLLGLFIVRGVRRTVRIRRRLLTHGVLTKAIVTDHRHGLGLAILAGITNVVFDVVVALPGGGTRVESFSSPIAVLRDELTVDSEIQALVDPDGGAVLFPAQFNVRLVTD